MNRAENIIALVNFAVERDGITRKDAVRVLSKVASLLNSDQNTDIDASPAMVKLWKEVNRKWWDPNPDDDGV